MNRKQQKEKSGKKEFFKKNWSNRLISSKDWGTRENMSDNTNIGNKRAYALQEEQGFKHHKSKP